MRLHLPQFDCNFRQLQVPNIDNNFSTHCQSSVAPSQRET
jgi:hypothetical protein